MAIAISLPADNTLWSPIFGVRYCMEVSRVKKAQTTAAPQVIKCDTVFDEWKWDQFVISAGLERASLDEYYLGKVLDNITVSDCSEIFTNLFSDAVLSGAVFLPSPYTYGDFTFKVVERSRGVMREVHVMVSLKGKPQTGGNAYGISSKVFSCTLSSHVAKTLIVHIIQDANISLSHVLPVILEDSIGSKRWYLDGRLHREDGPAIEHMNGGTEWLLNGIWHRVGGPAIEGADGSAHWWVNGKQHREDGPAVEYVDGSNEWWVNGRRSTRRLSNV